MISIRVDGPGPGRCQCVQARQHHLPRPLEGLILFVFQMDRAKRAVGALVSMFLQYGQWICSAALYLNEDKRSSIRRGNGVPWSLLSSELERMLLFVRTAEVQDTHNAKYT